MSLDIRFQLAVKNLGRCNCKWDSININDFNINYTHIYNGIIVYLCKKCNKMLYTGGIYD